MGGTPIINQCFEEAIQRCLNLTQSATDTAEVAGLVRESARDIGALLASEEADALHQAYVEAVTTIGRIRAALTEEEDTAVGSLDGLGQRARETASTVGQLLASVRQDAAHLAQLRERLLANLELEAGQSDLAFDELAKGVDEYRRGLESSLAEAADRVEQLRRKVAWAREGLEDPRQALTAAMSRLATGAMEVTRQLIQGVDAMLGPLGRETVEFCNVAIERHNTAVLAIRRGFTADSSSPDPPATWMGEFLAPVWEAALELELTGTVVPPALVAAANALWHQAGSAERECQGILDGLSRTMPPQLP